MEGLRLLDGIKEIEGLTSEHLREFLRASSEKYHELYDKGKILAQAGSPHPFSQLHRAAKTYADTGYIAPLERRAGSAPAGGGGAPVGGGGGGFGSGGFGHSSLVKLPSGHVTFPYDPSRTPEQLTYMQDAAKLANERRISAGAGGGFAPSGYGGAPSGYGGAPSGYGGAPSGYGSTSTPAYSSPPEGVLTATAAPAGRSRRGSGGEAPVPQRRVPNPVEVATSEAASYFAGASDQSRRKPRKGSEDEGDQEMKGGRKRSKKSRKARKSRKAKKSKRATRKY